MPTYDITVQNSFAPYQCVSGETELMLQSYGCLSAANIYFDNRLRNRPWKLATVDERKAALREATALIDNLHYIGCKSSSIQDHEFPRNGSLIVPSDIEIACYEIALKLIDGYNPELEISNLAAVSQSYSTARTTYERSFVLEHIRSGIPSAKAWALLKPYLEDPLKLMLRRVN